MKRAVVYSRISRDADQEGKGVDRQEEDCQALIEKRGWTLVETYRDNDVSAAGAIKKARPEFDAMLAAGAKGEFDVLVSYSNSRLSRRPAEWLDLISLANAQKFSISTVVSGQHDLTTADGRAVAMTVAIWDAAEAERTSERLTRQKAQRAAEGKAQGGRYRVYGYTRSWDVIEEEAEVVREAFSRRASGESLTAIAKDLTSRGLTTVEFICRQHSAEPAGIDDCEQCSPGKPWRSGNLAKMLSKALYAGIRESKGIEVGKTAFEPIIDESTYRAVTSELVKDSKGTNTRRHLLSGFLVCSKCFVTMKGKTTNEGTPMEKSAYVCSAAAGGCGKTTVKKEWADDCIVQEMHFKQQKIEPVDSEPVTEADDVKADIEAIDAKIEELQSAYTDGDLALPDLMKLQKGLRANRTELEKKQGELKVLHWGILQPFEDWDAMNLAQQRVYLERYISNVMVYPPKNAKGKNVRDDSRLEVHFTDGEVKRLANPGYSEVTRWEDSGPVVIAAYEGYKQVKPRKLD